MAREYRESMRFDDAADLWGAALRALEQHGYRIRSEDKNSWRITARLPTTLTSGPTIMQIEIFAGMVDCTSRLELKFGVSDFGANKRNVTKVLRTIADEVRSGPAVPGQSSTIGAAADTGTAHPAASEAAAAHEVVVGPTTMGEPILETIAIDECPIDNTNGSNPLQVEQEFTQTVTVGVNVENQGEIAGSFGVSGWHLLNAELRALAKRTYGVSEETQITRSYRATFTVGPHERTLYRVEWRRRRHPGEVTLSDGDKQMAVPFSVISDLEYGVSTHRLD